MTANLALPSHPTLLRPLGMASSLERERLPTAMASCGSPAIRQTGAWCNESAARESSKSCTMLVRPCWPMRPATSGSATPETRFKTIFAFAEAEKCCNGCKFPKPIETRSFSAIDRDRYMPGRFWVCSTWWPMAQTSINTASASSFRSKEWRGRSKVRRDKVPGGAMTTTVIWSARTTAMAETHAFILIKLPPPKKTRPLSSLDLCPPAQENLLGSGGGFRYDPRIMTPLDVLRAVTEAEIGREIVRLVPHWYVAEHGPERFSIPVGEHTVNFCNHCKLTPNLSAFLAKICTASPRPLPSITSSSFPA